MTQSRVNKTYDYTENKWVVSLVNTTGLIEGHAVIVVEGLLPNGRVFEGEYDITASAFPEEQEFAQDSLGNVMGYITKIRCNPIKNDRENNPDKKTVFYRNYDEKNFSSRSHNVTRENTLAMIESIEADADLLETEVASAKAEKRNVNWPFRYQKAGSGRSTLFGGNGGESCITWAEKKIAIATGHQVTAVADSSKAVTSIHIGCSLF